MSGICNILMKSQDESTHSYSSKRIESRVRIKTSKSSRSPPLPAPSFKRKLSTSEEETKEVKQRDRISKIKEGFYSVMVQCEKQTPHILAGGRLESLSYISHTFLKEKSDEVVYVCGPPGTGKTAGVLKICENEAHQYLNIMTYKTAAKWLRGLFEKMKRRGKITKEQQKCTSEELILKVLMKCFSKEEKIVVVIVDQVDNFAKRDLSHFTRLLETLVDSQMLRIIAIANTVNLLQESIGSVKFHQILCPQYSHHQSMAIVESRINFALNQQNLELEDLFQRDALRKLAMVMQRGEPDVRKLLEIVIETSKQALQRIAIAQQTQGVDNQPEIFDLSLMRVRMKDMNQVLKKWYGSAVERVMSKIPKTTKIYAGIVARKARKQNAAFLKQSDTLIELNRFLKAYKLDCIGPGALNDLITSLEFEGMLERFTKRIKGKNVQMVKMKMNIAEIADASNEIFELWHL